MRRPKIHFGLGEIGGNLHEGERGEEREEERGQEEEEQPEHPNVWKERERREGREGGKEGEDELERGGGLKEGGSRNGLLSGC